MSKLLKVIVWQRDIHTESTEIIYCASMRVVKYHPRSKVKVKGYWNLYHFQGSSSHIFIPSYSNFW